MEAVTEAATAMVAVEEEAMVAAVVVVVSVAEIATAAAEAEASVVDEVAAAEAVVVAVTTVIKMVTSPVNAPNKGKSATRSSPPGLTKGWYPYLSHSQNVMTVAEHLCMINAGYYLYPLLCYCEIIPSVLLLHYAYNVPTLPMYFCENFGHHMVYFMKYLSVLRQPTLIFHTT